MSYARVETSVPRHPKFLRAGPAASWLWLAGVCYCQDALTDGFIATEAIGTLGVTKPLPLAAVLVRERLWEVVDGGWRVHDYLEHNNSAEYIHRVKEAKRAAGRNGGRPRKPRENTTVNLFAFGLLNRELKQLENPAVATTVEVAEPVSVPDEKQERQAGGSPLALGTVEPRMLAMVGAHRRSRSRETTDGRAPIRVITALARHVLTEHADLDEGELMERVKQACARANLAYGGVVGEAIDRARAQLAKQQRRRAS